MLDSGQNIKKQQNNFDLNLSRTMYDNWSHCSRRIREHWLSALTYSKEIEALVNITVVRSGKGGKREEEQLADKIVYSLDEAINTDIQAAIISTPASKHIDQALALA